MHNNLGMRRVAFTLCNVIKEEYFGDELRFGAIREVFTMQLGTGRLCKTDLSYDHISDTVYVLLPKMTWDVLADPLISNELHV